MPDSTSWRGLKMAVIDVEATGLDAHNDHIVEVAVAHVTLSSDEGNPVELAMSQRVRPPIAIPAGATEVHGISDDDVADCPVWADVLPEVVAACEGRVIAAHSAQFDERIIARKSPDALPSGWLCTQAAGMAIDKYKRGKTLTALCFRRGIVLDAHGAAGDAVATALLFPMLLAEAWRGVYDRRGNRMMPQIATVEEYLKWQRTFHLDREREFVDYLYGQGAHREPDSPWHEYYGVEPPPWEAPEPLFRIDKSGRVIKAGEAA